MKRRLFGLLGAAAMAAALPIAASAQVRVGVAARIGSTSIAVGPEFLYVHVRGDHGPAFCRDGRGHPVHGWRWCARRGWERRPVYHRPDPRHTPRRYSDRWVDVRWTDLHFHRHHGRRDGHLNQRELFELMGRDGFRHIRRQADRVGLTGRLDAVWYNAGRGAIGLDVRAQGIPIVRLVDYNRDGWVDHASARTHVR